MVYEIRNNSKRAFIFLFILVLVLIVTFGIIYYFYERPKQEIKYIYSNISVFALENGKRKVINYTLETNDKFINGTTFIEGASFHQVLINNSFKVYNLGTEYYTDEIFIENTFINNYRINLNLVRPGNITFNHSKLIDNNINLTIFTEGEYKNSILCLNWGTHFIVAEINGYERVINEKYPKCYSIGDLNESKNIIINYKFFGILDKKDYIDIFLIDEINTFNNYTLLYKDFQNE